MVSQPHLDHRIGAYLASTTADQRITDLAEHQHGPVARRQLIALGIGRRQIERRIAEGRLHVLHRGIYAVGHRVLTRRGWWMAAVLAAGPGAVLSHRSAAALWGLRDWTGRHEVTAAGRRRAHGVLVHVSEVPHDELTSREKIPVTSLHRTMLDLAAVLTPGQLARAADRAETLGLTDPLPLDALLSRHRGRPGIAALRALRPAYRPTRSELEERFVSYLECHGLPLPQTNVPLRVDGETVHADCLWTHAQLVVELDSRAWHDASTAFEEDRRRDRRLAAALGLRTVRVTWRQLGDDEVARDLRTLLAAARRNATTA
jgi:very-short-patch-repair endonuclease